MKKTNLILKIGLVIALSFPFFSYSQELVDEDTFVDADGRQFKVGDDLLLGEVQASTGYKFIQNVTKKKIGWMSKMASQVSDVGKSVAKVGADVGADGALTKGAQLSGTANSTSDLADKSEKLLVKEEDITGQSLRILKFKHTGSEKRGEHFYAIVAGPGKANYEVEIIPAIQTGEIVGLNNQAFHQEK